MMRSFKRKMADNIDVDAFEDVLEKEETIDNDKSNDRDKRERNAIGKRERILAQPGNGLKSDIKSDLES